MTVEFQDSDVFQRTRKGQQEGVSAGGELDAKARRVLLVLNGFTTLGVLRQFLESEGEADLAPQLDALYAAGYIAPASMLSPMERQPRRTRRADTLNA